VRYLSVAEIIELHARLISQSGGAIGLRDRAALESSLAQPLQSFGGEELYPSIEEKAAALGYFLISNHPFVDGNKRVGHAAMEVMLVLNAREISATVEEQERTVLLVAAGRMTRDEFTAWVVRHVTPGRLTSPCS
jgi:death-on-curing protein